MGRAFSIIGFTMFASLFFMCTLGVYAAAGLLALSAFLFVLFLAVRSLRKNKALLTAFAACMFSALLFFFYYYGSYLPVMHYVGKEVSLSGTVLDYPDFRYDRYYYDVKVERVNGETLLHPFQLRATFDEEIGAEPADSIQMKGKVYALGSDSRFLKLHYISKSQFVGVHTSLATVQTAEGGGFKGLNYYFAHYRMHMVRSLQRFLPEDNAALAIAVLIGEKSYIPSDILSQISKAGISHIICVSGLHLSILGFGVIQLLKKLHTPRKARYLLGMAFILFFMALCGFSTSVVRAGIMFLIYLFAELILAEPDSKNSLGFAAFLILLKPFNAVNIGFIFSFLATLFIITLGAKITEKFKQKWDITNRNRITRFAFTLFEIFLISVIVNVGTFPFSALIFQKVSLIGVAANILILPFATVLLISVGACALIGLLPQPMFAFAAYPFAFAASVLCAYILIIVKLLTAFSFSNIFCGSAGIIFGCAVVLLWIAGGLLLLKTAKAKRVMALVCILVMAASFTGESLRAAYRCEIKAFALGYSSALSVKAGNEYILINAGTGVYTLQKITDDFEASHATAIDYFILTGEKRTQSGTAASVFRHFPVKRVITAENQAFAYELPSDTKHISAQFYAFRTHSGACIHAYFGQFSAVHITYKGQTALFVNSDKIDFTALPASMRDFKILIVQGKMKNIVVNSDIDGIIELSREDTSKTWANNADVHAYSSANQKDIKLIITAQKTVIGSENEWLL